MESLPRSLLDGDVEPVSRNGMLNLACRSGALACRATVLSLPERIVCAYVERGIFRLAFINTRTREFEPIDAPYTDIRYVRASNGTAVMRVASPTEPASDCPVGLRHPHLRHPKTLKQSQH